MTEEGTAIGSSKKPRRGRRQDDSLPPSRSRDVQRAFRARRAAKLSYLEDTVEWLHAENRALRELCGLKPDGPPLTGPQPVELSVDGPADPPQSSNKKATKAASAKSGKGKGSQVSEPDLEAMSEVESKADGLDDESLTPHDEARGAAQVLAGSAAPRTANDASPTIPFHSTPSTSAAPYDESFLPTRQISPRTQQTSPRMQQTSPRIQGDPNRHQPMPQAHPPALPYLVNHPLPNNGFPQQPPPPFSHMYHNYPFAPNPTQFNTYYPPHPPPPQYSQHHQAPYSMHFSPSQTQPPLGNGAFSMTLPSASSQPFPPMPSSHRTSLSSSAGQATPPSSHMRAPTVPSSAPHQSYQVYPAHTSAPATIISDLNLKSTYPHHSGTTGMDDRALKQSGLVPSTGTAPPDFNSMFFPTPSSEDEQFFLDTFCRGKSFLDQNDHLLQTLYSSFSGPDEKQIDVPQTEKQRRNGVHSGDEHSEKDKNEVTRKEGERYQNFCIGLMKGVQGIEGLIAQKRKRDQGKRSCAAAREEDGQERDRKRVRIEGSPEDRKEKEDETVAFLAQAAAVASGSRSGSDASEGEGVKDVSCCEGIIDCGPPAQTAPTSKLKQDDTCCHGLIDCGPSSTTVAPKEEDDDDQCCQGLISCNAPTDAPSTINHNGSPRISSPIELPASTIYLPRFPTSLISASRRKSASTSADGAPPSPASGSSSSDSNHDAYILVSLAFSQLRPHMSPSSSSSPTEIAELLHDNHPLLVQFQQSASGRDQSQEINPPNLIIVPPSPEEESRGQKGQLYVRRQVVEDVLEWCQSRHSTV
ncbi:uncharacterized protein JCM15063_006431 [Sporobolomyces koalae]|uniref:uncharacterized protein n=1 Tax=Sporobolomyces koalae TaxID=500713 RepID=UPI00316F4D09